MKGKKLKIFMSVIFATFAFIVSLTLTQAGDTIIVPDDYLTIQTAIDAASSGDKVRVRAGTYSLITNGEVFPIKMKNGVRLVGDGADVCILDAEQENQKSRVIVCNYIGDTSTKIEGFTITNGDTGLGGGIFCSFSSPIIANNIITGNSASLRGGGIYLIWFSSPNIINNVITGNSATINGGGIYCEFLSSPTITNNVITGNSASEIGGGIYSLFSYPTITNSIITKNTSKSGGGGIHSDDLFLLPIAFDDVWENIPEDYSGCKEGEGYSSVDPRFVDPTAGDYHLSEDSPCIDAGFNDAPELPGSDLDGNPRIVDGNDDGKAVVDMGAFEYQGVLAIEATIDIDPDTLNLKSKGNWITAYIELPEGYDVADINVDTLVLILKDPEDPEDPEYPVEAEKKPASIGDDDGDGIFDLMVKFDRAAVERQLEVGDYVEITVSGSLNGTQFVGTDIIRVISKGKK